MFERREGTKDILSSDARFRFNFVPSLRQQPHKTTTHDRYTATATVTAVRVSCSGEARKRDKIKELCAYSIPTTHEIFTHGELSQFSILIGIPVLICTIRPSMIVPRPPPLRRDYYHDIYDAPKRTKVGPMYSYKATDNYYPNLVAGAVMAGNADGQQRWTEQVGAVLLARVDKKPLETGHVHVLLGLLNDAAHTASTIWIDKALQMLTPASFKTFYGQNAASIKAHNEGEEWSDSTPWDDESVRLFSEEDEEL